MSVYVSLWTVSPEPLPSSGTDTPARSENQKSKIRQKTLWSRTCKQVLTVKRRGVGSLCQCYFQTFVFSCVSEFSGKKGGGGVIADLSFNLIKSSRGSVGEKTELMILHLLRFYRKERCWLHFILGITHWLQANLLQLIRRKGRLGDNYHGRNLRQSWQSCFTAVLC